MNPSYDPSNPMLSKHGVDQQYHQLGFDPNGNNEAWGSLQRLFPTYFTGAASNAQFGAGLNTQRQSAISALLRSLTPASQTAQMQELQRGNTEQAAGSARSSTLMNREMGLGDGFAAGNTASSFGQADRMNNDIARQYASPEHQMSALQTMLQAIGYGQQNPELEELYRMGSVLEQRHQANQAEMGSGSALRTLAPIAGQIAGMYTGGMGGGGNGGPSQGGGGFAPQQGYGSGAFGAWNPYPGYGSGSSGNWGQ